MIQGMRLASLALVFVLLPLGGCSWLTGEGGEAPCDNDLSGCFDDTSTFMEDPSCTRTGELDIQLGEGETMFTPLEAGELPQIHHGFQGGQHVWMAVRVKNPDLDRKQLKIRVKLEYCNEGCDDPDNWEVDNLRELVAEESTMTITPEGWMEQTRMLVTVFGWVDAQQRRLEMLVTDPCGRQGIVTRVSP